MRYKLLNVMSCICCALLCRNKTKFTLRRNYRDAFEQILEHIELKRKINTFLFHNLCLFSGHFSTIRCTFFRALFRGILISFYLVYSPPGLNPLSVSSDVEPTYSSHRRKSLFQGTAPWQLVSLYLTLFFFR